VTSGAPEDVVDADLIREVYGVDCLCLPDPVNGRPMIVPLDTTAPIPTAPPSERASA
jgi:iron complex transport system ATP-binding protein